MTSTKSKEAREKEKLAQQIEDHPLQVLLVDDDRALAETLAETLEALEAECRIAGTESEAMELLPSRLFDVIVTDMKLEKPESGIHILKASKEMAPETEVIMMTGKVDGPGSVNVAVESMRQGAFNYLVKPLNMKEFRVAVQRAAESTRLRRINLELQRRLDERFGFEGVIGNSPQMHSLVERLKRIAPTDAAVLIQGETGTGKELVAQALHQNSPRKSKPFVALNCAALSENILESELFGHVKGAFTDATSDRVGKFEYANGGTLFLDEVGDMPMATQIKLLRVLENGEITRVGSNDSIKVNVRLISATNRDLKESLESGSFRRDLYHRLKVVTIRIPNLRQRSSDIPVLIDHFLKMFSKKHGKKIKGVTQEARRRLFAYDWPGNVRQLRNAIESMVVVDFDELLDVDDLPEEMTERDEVAEPTAGATLARLVGKPMAEVERLFIAETLQAASGNREEAAKMLGIGERTLYRKIKEYELT